MLAKRILIAALVGGALVARPATAYVDPAPAVLLAGRGGAAAG